MSREVIYGLTYFTHIVEIQRLGYEKHSGESQGIGDVIEDHEIQLVNGNRGRVAHYVD